MKAPAQALTRALPLFVLLAGSTVVLGAERPRTRDLGLSPGILSPGPVNAITDVAGVAVGHVTVVEGDSVRTGVTAVLPHPGNLFRDRVPAAVWVGNGFGKAAGFLQVRELGELETPIVLTNTLAVGTAVRALVEWTLEQPGNEEVRSVNAVVGETNDGWLNDIRRPTITARHVREAIAAARSGPVAEGAVGAGTGTRAFGWKGGIGTASRELPGSLGGFTVGALVQSNFGGVLTVDGLPVGETLGRHSFDQRLRSEVEVPAGEREAPRPDGDAGSCMVVVATDAPLDSRNLERLASRAVLGLARTGSFLANGSGDFVIAFSTDREGSRSRPLANDEVDPLFLAVVEAVEEAVYNSLLRATDTTGHRGTLEALPLEPLRRMIEDRGR